MTLMKTNFWTLSVMLIPAFLSPCMAYEDRFDAPSSNWQDAFGGGVNRGTAAWSIADGRMNFFSGLPTNSYNFDNHIAVTTPLQFSNSQDWSFTVGLNNAASNAASAWLYIYVANDAFSELFGVYSKGTIDGSRNWVMEAPGFSDPDGPSAPTATATQQGSIKIDYFSSSRTYSLSYFNGGIDPISNPGSWTSIDSYVGSEQGKMNLYVGFRSEDTVAYGDTYFDNFQSVPEPSALSLLAVGLGLVLRRSRRTV